MGEERDGEGEGGNGRVRGTEREREIEQRTTCGSQYLLPTIWVLESKLRLSGSVTGISHPPCHPHLRPMEPSQQPLRLVLDALQCNAE